MAGRTASGRIKKGYRLTKGGRTVKSSGRGRRRSSSPRRKRRGGRRGGLFARLFR